MNGRSALRPLPTPPPVMGGRAFQGGSDMNEPVIEPATSAQRTMKGKRRLWDHVLGAFHSACDDGNLAAAADLLGILSLMVRRGDPRGRPDRRNNGLPLIAAHERLWSLRHAEARDD
jgi:hypothetical protein